MSEWTSGYRVLQDGDWIKLSANKAIDFRVNITHIVGENRAAYFRSVSAQMGIDALNIHPSKRHVHACVDQPQGMILVTGPTGSGKTVSLYTGLNILNTTEINISTAEDPVEINLEGINQVHVNPKVGLTFAEALRAFLRQDPDVVMVGEIRDLETAEIGIKAANPVTWCSRPCHQLGARNPKSTRNMGVPANIATSVSLIIAQRLARRLCKHCKKPVDAPPEALKAEGFTDAELASHTIYEPVGCDQCMNGYKGRVGVYEVVSVRRSCPRSLCARATRSTGQAMRDRRL